MQLNEAVRDAAVLVEETTQRRANDAGQDEATKCEAKVKRAEAQVVHDCTARGGCEDLVRACGRS